MMMVTYEWKCVCIRSFVAFFLNATIVNDGGCR